MKVIIIGKNSFIGNKFKEYYSVDLEINEVCTLTNSLEQIEMSGYDAAIHLAAIVHQSKKISEKIYFKINRDLAFEVAKKAKSQGVKHFVFMSTAKVFGESTTGMSAWNENSECNPLDAYGKSKFEAEKLIKSLEDENFRVAIIRSPLVYGPEVKANMYNLVKLINKFPILPFAGISNRRSVVYVLNLVALLRQVLDKQYSGILIAGDRHPISTTHLAKIIAKTSNRKVYFLKMPHLLITAIKRMRPSMVDRLFGSLELDNSYTNKNLDFIPPYDTEYGIQQMVDWYQNK